MWFWNFFPPFLLGLFIVIQLGILVSLSEISPSFCIFKITGQPLFGKFWTWKVLLQTFWYWTHVFLSCLVERFTFGNVGQWPSNEQWRIEKNLLLLDYECGGILFCQNPLLRFVGAFFTTFKCASSLVL